MDNFSTLQCPHCLEDVNIPLYDDLEYHKYGRQCKCPLCNKNIIVHKTATNYKQDKNGSLRTKYKPKKR